MLKTSNNLILIGFTIGFILIILLNKPQIFPDSYYYHAEALKLFKNEYEINSFKILYSIWILINYFSTKLLGQNWYYFIILLNLFSSIFIIYLSLKITNISGLSNIILFSLMQIFCIDLWIYNSYVLSDLFFTVFSTLIFISTLKYIKTNKTKHILIVFFLIFFLFFLRPTSMPLLLFVLLALFIKIKFHKFFIFNFFIYASILFIFIFLISIFQKILITNDFIFYIKILNNYIYWLKLQFHDGIIIYDRPEYNVGNVNDISSILYYNINKLILYYNFIPIGYSNNHKLINLIYIILIIVSIFKFKIIDKSNFDIVSIYLISVFILAFGIFHMITIIDYDWRYRLPILPILTLIPFLIYKNNNTDA